MQNGRSFRYLVKDEGSLTVCYYVFNKGSRETTISTANIQGDRPFVRIIVSVSDGEKSIKYRVDLITTYVILSRGNPIAFFIDSEPEYRELIGKISIDCGVNDYVVKCSNCGYQSKAKHPICVECVKKMHQSWLRS
jgi:hypothetical protein